MLLFWRKRKRGIGRTYSDNLPVSSHDGRKTLILLVVLHVYIVICAYVFQQIEYVEAKEEMPNLRRIAANLSRRFNYTANQSMELIRNIITAANADRTVYMTDSWKSFSKAFWFVTILFTTVGTGHIVPITFKGRLMAIITALIGIPLYALFLKHFGECILYANKRLLGLCSCSKLSPEEQKWKNTKIVLVAFFEMMIIIFTGALGAFPFNWTYFQGIYFCFISLSTVGFGDLIPDLSGDKAFYGIVYMFYNVIGLSFVSCFICSVVNAIDDFNAMRATMQWAAKSLRISKSNDNNKDGCVELYEVDLKKRQNENDIHLSFQNGGVSMNDNNNI